MGVSVSASTAIIVAGLFVAFGALAPVASNGFDRVTDANQDVQDRALDRQNTDLDSLSAVYNETTTTLSVTLNNTGTTTLSIGETTLLVDNQYHDLGDEETTIVRGSGSEDVETTLWQPGEQLRIELDIGEEPDRVTVVSEHAVSVGTNVDVEGGGN